MICFIRHGLDVPDPKYKNDALLDTETNKDLITHAFQLVAKYGTPTAVYTSPLRRTEQTAVLFANVVRLQFRKPVEVAVCPNFTRFFGGDDKKLIGISPATKCQGVVVADSMFEFQQNVWTGITWLMGKHPGQVVWVITHAKVIKAAYQFCKMKSPRSRYPFLYTAVFSHCRESKNFMTEFDGVTAKSQADVRTCCSHHRKKDLRAHQVPTQPQETAEVPSEQMQQVLNELELQREEYKERMRQMQRYR